MGEIYALTPYIAQVLKSRGVPQRDREDLIQRVLLGAWQAIAAGRFRRDPDIPLRAWVAEIARRQAFNYWRASRSRKEQLTDPDLTSTSPKPSQTALAAWKIGFCCGSARRPG
jgi:RNA polymerase sigma-70 factor (ECF subfamily)